MRVAERLNCYVKDSGGAALQWGRNMRVAERILAEAEKAKQETFNGAAT